jgi:basic membrane protein A
VLAIGNVINTQDKYPDTVVASALWNMEPTIDAAIKAVKAGKLQGRGLRPLLDMKHKGSELAPIGTFEGKVPKAVIDKVRARTAEILAGSFTVKVDDSQPKGTAK